MFRYLYCIYDSRKTYEYIFSLRGLPPTYYTMFEVNLPKIRGGRSKADARRTCFEGGIHESSSRAATKLELGMFPKSNSYETFRIESMVNIVILSGRIRSSKYPRLETEAVEGVDDDVRMPDRSPSPAIRRVVAARLLPSDRHHAATPLLPLSPAPPSSIGTFVT